MKAKLTIPEQVEHLKSKGIKFNIINELEAQKVLSENTYYFKLKIYTKNYDKQENDKYKNIEFSYLYELSKLDLAFRNFVLKLTLNIEHLAKTKLLKDFNTSNEDGYTIVSSFLQKYEKANQYIEDFRIKDGEGGNYDIVKHYGNGLPLWALVEILQFNDFMLLYKFFYLKNKQFLEGNKLGSHMLSLNSVKWLRNLSAHNNCLLIKLNKFDTDIRTHLQRKISPFRMSIESRDKNYTIEKMLKNSIIEAFLETWLFFLRICNSDKMKLHAKDELRSFFEYSRQSNKLECRKSSCDIDNFFNFLEKICKIF